MINVRLSKATQKLLKKRQGDTNLAWPSIVPTALRSPQTEEIPLTELTPLLQGSLSVTDDRYFLESLNACLLKDINTALRNETPKEKKNKKETGWHKLGFFLIMVAITLWAGFEGFDAIGSFLQTFSVPALVVFIVGLAFSIASMALSYYVEKKEIAEAFSVDKDDASNMLGVFLQQDKIMKLLEASIYSRDKKSSKDHDELLALAMAVQQRDEDMALIREKMKQRRDVWWLKAFQAIPVVFKAICAFSGGFMAGQTVGVAIAALCVAAGASVNPTFWPIILVSVVAGLAFVAAYWYLERPAVQNMLGRWMDVDKEQIDNFSSESKNAQQSKLYKELVENLQGGYEESEIEEPLPPAMQASTSGSSTYHPEFFKPGSALYPTLSSPVLTSSNP